MRQRRKAELARSAGIFFYRPHAKQDEFHRCQARWRLVRAGNRFGKSHMGCAEDVAWLLGERYWYPPQHPARKTPRKPPVKGLVVTTNLEKVEEVWTGSTGKLWQMLPRFAVARTSKSHTGVTVRVELKNGSTLQFYTVKQWLVDPFSAESVDYDFIHVDEPCPRDLFVGVSRGLLDRGGYVWFTLTPLTEPWIVDEFARRSDAVMITGSTYDNPFLTPGDIAEFERLLTEDERQCRIHGLPLHLAGLVYKEFDPSVHILRDPPWDKPPRDWPIYVAIDPHPRTPHAVLFCTVSPFGKRYYYYDMFVHCGIEALVKGDPAHGVEGILPFLEGRRPVWTKMDPLGFIEDPEDGNSMAEEAARAGLVCEKATKALAQGILHVKQELLKRDIHGKPMIYFHPNARRTLWEIQRWCWDERSNKPVDEDDHMMENLYRLELSGPRWIEPDKSPPIPDMDIVCAEIDDLEPICV